ncbi:MAG: lipopolysaccharide heptosyltransferase II [Candidatus Latescibacterota bacterium]
MVIQDTRRIVVIAPNWLGDAVMSLSLIGMLRRADRVRLALMCPQYTARIFYGIDGIDEIIVFPAEGITRGLRMRSRTLCRLRLSAAIILPPSFSSALAPFLARVPYRIAYPADGRRFLLNKPADAARLRTEHLSQSYQHLGAKALACVGAEIPAPGGTPALTVCAKEIESIERTLHAIGAPRRDFCLVVPGATYGSAKTWPREAFRETVRRISRSVPVILAGGSAEQQACGVIAAALHGVYDMSGKTTLGEFFALTQAASVLIANDSGAAHVAGSVGTPAVVIFGSTSPRWTAPLGRQVSIVRRPTLCSPCFLKECSTELECFAGIRPEDVAGEALRLAKKGVDILPAEG